MTDHNGAHAVVLGGAGFLGSHLCDRLVSYGARVTVIDNFITGNADNLDHLVGEPGFRLVTYDVTDYLHVLSDVDWVIHFAALASPVDYQRYPIQTLKVGALGTHKALGLALEKGAAFLLASTSEVYGDPQVSPQPETYWGNVNPVGPRSVYDEAKRYAEALTVAYHRAHDVDVRIARIFNTYGPRMRIDDGRAVPEFCVAALESRPLPVHGDGSQTRSLCYVDDLIEGILLLLESGLVTPVNLGNPTEINILELAEAVQHAVGIHPGVEFRARPEDDPAMRCPDISLARETLGWTPRVTLSDGLAWTAEWFRGQINR